MRFMDIVIPERSFDWLKEQVVGVIPEEVRPSRYIISYVKKLDWEMEVETLFVGLPELESIGSNDVQSMTTLAKALVMTATQSVPYYIVWDIDISSRTSSSDFIPMHASDVKRACVGCVSLLQKILDFQLVMAALHSNPENVHFILIDEGRVVVYPGTAQEFLNHYFSQNPLRLQ